MANPEPIFFSSCSNDERFVVFEGEVEAVTARAACQARGGDLGPVRGATEFSLVTNFVRQTGLVQLEAGNNVARRYFFGLEALDGQDIGGNPLQFSFVADPGNDTGLDFYHVDKGQFPWRTDQPNNPENEQNVVQNCAAILFQDENAEEVDDELVDGLVEDIDCELTANFICREPCQERVDDVEVDGKIFKLVHDVDSEPVYTAGQGDELCAKFNDDETEFESARITNASQFNRLRAAIAFEIGLAVQANVPFGLSVGLQVPENAQADREALDTSVFKFTDVDNTDGLDFFQGEAEEFPWRPGQPSNLNGNQHCTQLQFVFQNQEEIRAFNPESTEEINGCLDDVECFDRLIVGFICSVKEVQVGGVDDNGQVVELVLLSGLFGLLGLLLVFVALFMFERRQMKKIASILVIRENPKSSFIDESLPRTTLPTMVSQDI